VLFIPADDLFEEIARRDDLVETLRRDFHVIVAGPATLPTLVMGLRAAFKGTTPKAVGGGAGNGSLVGWRAG
jgi:DNA anti-recombination protein RmuC